MSLHLIPMLSHTPEKVRTTMHIQHDPRPRILRRLPLIIIRAHLNPFGLDLTAGPAPLPPCLAPYFLYPMMPQLLLYVFCGFLQVFVRDLDFVDFDPAWVRHPLRGEALDVFDCVV